MIPLDKYIVRADSVVWQMFDGEAVLMSEDGSQMHMLNKVGSYIWGLADGKTKVSEIITSVYDRFDIEKEVALADSIEFIQKLFEMELFKY